METVNDPLFIGYYTAGTPYESEAASLRASLDGLGLPHDIVGIRDRGTWNRNTHAKAEVIAGFIARYPGRRLAYIDVDAYVISRPDLFWTIDSDFAAHLWDSNELLSGTMFFRANQRTAELVSRWRVVCEKYLDTLPDGRPAWDQRCLLVALHEMRGRIAFMDLPHSYCWMIGLSQRERPRERPVILHKEGLATWKRKPTWKIEDGKWTEIA